MARIRVRFGGYVSALLSNARLLSTHPASSLNRLEGSSTAFKHGFHGSENCGRLSWQISGILHCEKPKYTSPTFPVWPRQSWHIKDFITQTRSPVLDPLMWKTDIIGDLAEKARIQDSFGRRDVVHASSVLKKRKKKMNKHKYKKRRKLEKYKRRNLENIKERKRRVREKAAAH